MRIRLAPLAPTFFPVHPVPPSHSAPEHVIFVTGVSAAVGPSRPPDFPLTPIFGAWRSPVAHLLWEQGVGGSNPLAPTNENPELVMTYRFGVFTFPPRVACFVVCFSFLSPLQDVVSGAAPLEESSRHQCVDTTGALFCSSRQPPAAATSFTG